MQAGQEIQSCAKELNCSLDVVQTCTHWHHAVYVDPLSVNFLYRKRTKNSGRFQVSGKISHKRCWCTSETVAAVCMFPINSCFNHCCRNVNARCMKVLAGRPLVLKDRDVLPISHKVCGLPDMKLKMHIEIRGHTQIAKIRKHQQMEKTSNSMNLCIQRSFGWPLLRGWPCMACCECWLCTVWGSIVAPPPLFAQQLLVPIASQDTEGELESVPDKPHVRSSWGCVRISRAAGDRPVFVQQKLRVVQYLKRVIITSVIRVLTGPHSCQRAMHPGNAWRRNRWPWLWGLQYVLMSVHTHCMGMSIHLEGNMGGRLICCPNTHTHSYGSMTAASRHPI